MVKEVVGEAATTTMTMTTGAQEAGYWKAGNLRAQHPNLLLLLLQPSQSSLRGSLLHGRHRKGPFPQGEGQL
jgi:hypothetical protein